MSEEGGQTKVGITIGDINGVGMEIILKTLSDNRVLKDFTPLVYGSSKIASFYRKALNIEEFNFLKISNADEAKLRKPNLVNCWDDEPIVKMGEANEDGGKYAIQSLQKAVEDLVNNKFDVLVTAPFNKDKIQGADFDFPGHTEYLAQMSNVDDALMLMVSEGLRVGVVTGHVPLKDVAEKLSTDTILSKLDLMHTSLLRDFLVIRPKIAVLGFNPHAGEQGLLGEEDEKHILPAIKEAKEAGMLVFGPYSADGFFGSGNFKNFDGVLAMYHDQGLIPFKTLTAGEGVNYTAGLPIVRTSPAHGTAYDLVGKNEADPASFRNACYLACDIYKNRKMYREMNANPLDAETTPENED